MAWNEQTLGQGKRTVLWSRVDRAAGRLDGARRVNVDVLLPYSLIEVDGTLYLETNSAYGGFAEAGGAHAVPTHGMVVGDEYAHRHLGVVSVDVPAGLTRALPPESTIHKQGWI